MTDATKKDALQEAINEVKDLTDDEIRSRMKMFDNNIKEFKR